MKKLESEKKEYWKWPEYSFKAEGVDWNNAKIIVAGIDVGSVSSKIAIFVDDELASFSIIRTGSNSPESSQKVMSHALEGTGVNLNDLKYIVSTGYGRVNVPFAQRAITEIACHGRGANYIWGPTVKTVLDMGGQDCKAISIDEKGKVVNFIMNDKCAAGTGRGMEVFADLLSIPIENIGETSLVKDEPKPVSSTCVVFAKSEALGLLRQGSPKESVVAAYCSAMSHRVFTLLERVGVKTEFVITGGIAKNIGVVSRLEKELGVKALPLPKEQKFDPQLAGAIGASLFAKTLYMKANKQS